jgi:predicted nucleic acid-binding protein
MIVLDTNVISELTKSKPEPRVIAWLDAQPAESVWTTAITVFEVRFGLANMPVGKKRRQLTEAFELMLQEDLGGRVLVFDQPAADEAGRIAGELRTMGRPIELRDGLIAGTVAARRGILATHNTRHFADTGIACIDPWTAMSPA